MSGGIKSAAGIVVVLAIAPALVQWWASIVADPWVMPLLIAMMLDIILGGIVAILSDDFRIFPHVYSFLRKIASLVVVGWAFAADQVQTPEIISMTWGGIAIGIMFLHQGVLIARKAAALDLPGAWVVRTFGVRFQTLISPLEQWEELTRPTYEQVTLDRKIDKAEREGRLAQKAADVLTFQRSGEVKIDTSEWDQINGDGEEE